jgi:hypothetical protein
MLGGTWGSDLNVVADCRDRRRPTHQGELRGGTRTKMGRRHLRPRPTIKDDRLNYAA